MFMNLYSHLPDSPRLSVFLVFLLSGSVCFGLSYLTKWLPGANGRFIAAQRNRHNEPLLASFGVESPKGSDAQQPKRPRRLSLPVLVVAIIMRLEIFHRVNYRQQCSTPGVEVGEEGFLPTQPQN